MFGIGWDKMMTKQYRGNDGRKQGFQRRNRFENKSDAVMSSVEEKILATLRAEEIHDWGARRLLRGGAFSRLEAPAALPEEFRLVPSAERLKLAALLRCGALRLYRGEFAGI